MKEPTHQFMVLSLPLPKDHWLYEEGHENTPASMKSRFQLSHEYPQLRDEVIQAARYAVRVATLNGKEKDFDPDALVQAMVVGLLGYDMSATIAHWHDSPTPDTL